MSDADLISIGRRIRDRRKHQGYTQEQLAEMMDVSVQMISNLERGNKAIRIDNLINLSRILDVSTDYILMGKTTTDDIDALSLCISRLQPKDRNMIELLIKYCLTESI